MSIFCQHTQKHVRTYKVSGFDAFSYVNEFKSQKQMSSSINTSGPPVIVKYKPLMGWFARAICSIGPKMLDITTLQFPRVL